MSFNKQYKVSVRLMTYNHAKFIEQALAGVLMQKTNFLVEVVVGDDFSSDGTLDKVRNFQNTEKIKIKILDRKKGDKYWQNRQRLGRLYNFTNILENCSGEYIALLDGDDYWTDPFKLQKQVDFLENNPDYVACFTNAKVSNEISGEEKKYLGFKENKNYPIEDIINMGGGLFPTASLVFRNIIKEWPNFMFRHKSGDRALALLLANRGSFYLLNEVTCVYRRHESGIYSSIIGSVLKRTEVMEDNISLLNNFNLYTFKRYDKVIKETISKIAFKILLINDVSLKSALTSFCFKSLLFKHKILYLKTKIYGEK